MFRKRYFSHLNKAYQHAPEIELDLKSNYLFMSDMHRGDCSGSDDFNHNKDICKYALRHYGEKNFTYIEIGDGDELWESNFSRIVSAHRDIYELIGKYFLAVGKYYYIWGNHDELWARPQIVARKLVPLYETVCRRRVPLKTYEGLKIKVRGNGLDEKIIFAVHGHQGELFSGPLWWLNYLVNRFVWKYCQIIGIKDFITGPAKNFKKRESAEDRYYAWAKHRRIMVIAGHTHRPVFRSLGKNEKVRGMPSRYDKGNAGVYYFNTGSGVHPNGITCIEIGPLNISGGENGEDVADHHNNLRLCLWQNDRSGVVRKRVLEQANLQEILNQL